MRHILMAAAIALCVTGCCGNASREAAFHDGVNEYANKSGMLNEYDAYIDADPKLSPDTKKIRKGTSQGLRDLIKTEGESLKKD